MSALTDMSIELLTLAKQTVTVTAKSSINSYGEPQHAGSPVTYLAYVQRVAASQRDKDDDEKAVEFTAYIPSTTYAPTLDDLLTIGSITRVVVETDIRFDEFGQQAVVLSLGKARRL
ncbi:hypothetical protein UFOVP1219_67 [uncultured Caudovirales phage]|uniref:Uncharacterized protein n=1 Tax=uncultured Caudovirales phage TaxID=2100421 RepID=A0A6J5Q1D2_9CAUD|nr:hypothetical protein UFOVP476_39 [uncultured Caudovirales phage]CAB4176467.1 hypothetical protein UFOVP986_36 [uncultured Caudovirales phage]CAB4191576.1 hypothetical protein UFOVP1219_67 [uncultured Caudovirales phage]CAB4223316.1 hypothetical protein UFOVP1671_42 [uncultured Caudovirales phage]CAB5220576.1 hypothetical protein UFOVP358_65 [uncultured Caudovirales phage]